MTSGRILGSGIDVGMGAFEVVAVGGVRDVLSLVLLFDLLFDISKSDGPVYPSLLPGLLAGIAVDDVGFTDETVGLLNVPGMPVFVGFFSPDGSWTGTVFAALDRVILGD